MADDNVIRATTSLDTSGLQAGMAQSQAIVAAGVGNIRAQYSSLHDEISRVIQAIREEGAASDLAIQRNLSMGRSFQQAAAGAQQLAQHANASGFSLRYAFFGIKDIAEGRFNFALAEIANELVRMGPAALAVGGALGLIGFSIYESLKPALEATKALEEQVKKDNKEFEQLGKTVEHALVELATINGGKASGARVAGFYDATTAAADRARIEYLNGLIDRTKQKINAEGGLTDFFANPVKAFNPFEFGIKFEELADARAELVNIKKYQDEIATLQERTYATGLEGLVKTSQATKDEIEEKKRPFSEAESAARKADTDAMEDLKARGGTFAEERALLRSEMAAQSQYTDVIRTLKGELNRVNQEAGTHFEAENRKYEENIKKEADLHKERERTLLESSLAIWRQDEEDQKRAEEAAAKEEADLAHIAEVRAQAKTDIAEIGAKGAGESADLAIQQKKLELEQQYARQVEHTNAQQVAELRAIAALDEQSRVAKIAGLQAEEAIAQATLNAAKAKELEHASASEDLKAVEDQTSAMKKIAELQQQINQLTQQNVNAGIQATTQAIILQEQKYKAFFDQLQSNFLHAFDSMITGQKNWEKQWEEVWNKSVEYVANTALKAILQAFIQHLGLQQAAQKAADAIMHALHISTAAAGKAIDTTAAAAEIATAAAVAAANAFAATAAIPFVGPELAPAAAATAYAEVMALQPAAALETGTNYVPRTGLYQLHEGEAVQPKQYNPAAGGSGNASFHYHAAPNASAADRQQDMEASFRQFKQMARRFNR